METTAQQVKAMLVKLKETADDSTVNKLDVKKAERILDRLASHTLSCDDCREHLEQINNHVTLMQDEVDDVKVKEYKVLLNRSKKHLETKHKVVEEGHYLALFMSIGMSLGVVFGLTIFDNIALGLPIGLCIGLGIGASLDADAKKKGLTL